MMTIRPPATPKWYRSAMRLPLATISSNEPMSLVRTAKAPHNNPKRRAVIMLAVSTNNGTAGRSREIRRAVDPDDVKHTMALVSTVSTIRPLASAKASAVVPSAGVSVKWMRLKKSGSPSTCCALRSMIDTASIGQAPAAVSADNITASAPS